MNAVALTPVLIVGIVFGAILIGLSLVCWVVVRVLGGGGRGHPGRHEPEEEAKLIQEVYHGLMRMEERVETLETILLERDPRGSKS